MRTILGAMKTTPIAEMEKTAGIEPLEGRRQAKLLIHAEKMKRMPDHLLHQKLKDPTKNRLKRKSLNHLVKEQQKEHADILTTDGPGTVLLPLQQWGDHPQPGGSPRGG